VASIWNSFIKSNPVIATASGWLQQLVRRGGWQHPDRNHNERLSQIIAPTKATTNTATADRELQGAAEMRGKHTELIS